MSRIFKFDNPADYLKFRFDEAKAANPRFSLRAWTKKLGLPFSASLSRVLLGKRPMTKALAQSIGPALRLKPEEQAYFEFLAEVSKIKDQSVLKQYLKLARETHEVPNTVSLQAFASISRWYSLVMLEMLKLSNFDEDPDWIVQALKKTVSRQEVSAMLGSLEQLGFAKRNSTGKLVRSSLQPIKIHTSLKEAAVEHYLAEQLAKSVEAAERLQVGQRKLGSISLALRREDLPKVKATIEEAHLKVLKLARDDNAEVVYQFNTQFFSVVE